jgi:hypothetical protein
MVRRPTKCPAASLIVALALTASCAGASDAGKDSTTTSSSSTTSTTARATTTSSTVADTSGLPLRPPHAATDAAGLAAQLTAAERAIRDPNTPRRELAKLAVVQQVAYRALGRRPELDDAVLTRIPHELGKDVRRNLVARRELRQLLKTVKDTVPAWHIVDPPAADELLRYYREVESTFGVKWQYVAAVNLVETGMGRIRGTSVSGAQGPMQFLPATWDAFGAGGDINDPHDAILAAGRYLAHNHGDTDIAGALWNYNHSDHYVRAVMSLADVMRDEPRTFHGYYHWGVFYLSTAGEVWLPIGYEQQHEIPAADYLATHPQ